MSVTFFEKKNWWKWLFYYLACFFLIAEVALSWAISETNGINKYPLIILSVGIIISAVFMFLFSFYGIRDVLLVKMHLSKKTKNIFFATIMLYIFTLIAIFGSQIIFYHVLGSILYTQQEKTKLIFYAADFSVSFVLFSICIFFGFYSHNLIVKDLLKRNGN